MKDRVLSSTEMRRLLDEAMSWPPESPVDEHERVVRLSRVLSAVIDWIDWSERNSGAILRQIDLTLGDRTTKTDKTE